MKVILATIHLEESTRSVPLAAACLKAIVINHDVLLKNYTLEQSADEIVRDLLMEKPDVLGFPVYLWNRSLVIDAIRMIKQRMPELPILAGGPEVTAAPAQFLEESEVLCAMQGEGEVMINPVLDALSEGLSIPESPGIWTKDYSPQEPAYCQDINSLESPILSGALDLAANEGLLWELSRGCPFACEFCFESKGCGKVRYFSLERVRKELEMIREAGVKQVFVLDPTFNVNKKRVMTILNWIAEETPDTYYYFEVRTEFLDEESAVAFSAIPCTLQIGLQSSDPEVLKQINRKFNPESFRERVLLLGDAGVSFGLDLIYGLPGDTLSGFRASLNYALSLEPNHIDIFPLAVLPGTVLFDRRGDLDIRSLENDPYLVTGSETFSAEDIIRADHIRLNADLLYNRGRGISWFRRVCYDLDLEPADVIDHWISIGSGNILDEKNIPVFLKTLYSHYGKQNLYPVLKDILEYLDVLEELEQLEITEEPDDWITIDDDSVFALHESVRFRDFTVHPELILEGFPASSEDLMTESGHYHAILWVRPQGVCMDMPNNLEMKILKTMSEGSIAFNDLKNFLSDREMKDFLQNGKEDGYLRRV